MLHVIPFKKRTFLGVTKKLRQLVETLSDTEYVEQLDMKSKLTKLSNLITKTSELIVSMTIVVIGLDSILSLYSFL